MHPYGTNFQLLINVIYSMLYIEYISYISSNKLNRSVRVELIFIHKNSIER
jgi:hypothetical protein